MGMRTNKYLYALATLGAYAIIAIGGISAFAYEGKEIKDANRTFFQANALYKKADYKKAISLYEELLKSGFQSGSLYYNLANSYFKNHQLGEAILNYERAKVLMPRDEQLRFNEKYVQSLRKRYSPIPTVSFWQRPLKSYADSLTLHEILWIICLGCIILSAFIWVGLFSHYSYRRIIIIAGLLMIFIMGNIGIFLSKKSFLQKTAVILSQTDALYEPRETATSYYKLAEGDIVSVIREENGWVKIMRSDGRRGWIPINKMEKIIKN